MSLLYWDGVLAKNFKSTWEVGSIGEQCVERIPNKGMINYVQKFGEYSCQVSPGCQLGVGLPAPGCITPGDVGGA